jgi:sodium/hydrogen exchanger 8
LSLKKCFEVGLSSLEIVWQMVKATRNWISFEIYFLIYGSAQVFGLMTKPLVRILLPQSKLGTSMTSSEPSSPKSFTVPLLSNGHDSEADKGSQHVGRPTSLRMLLSTPSHTVHHYWRKFDDAFMRPVFGGRGFVPFVPGSPTEQEVLQWPRP